MVIDFGRVLTIDFVDAVIVDELAKWEFSSRAVEYEFAMERAVVAFYLKFKIKPNYKSNNRGFEKCILISYHQATILVWIARNT